jgi:hypothetical protein
VIFGALHHLDLPPLSLFERALIKRFRLFAVIVKLTASTRESEQRALRGHIICMPHTGPTVAAAHMPPPDTLHFFQVVFVGPTGQRERLANELPRTAVRADVHRLWKWLRLLSSIHPDYQEFRSQFEGNEPTAAFRAEVEALRAQLVANIVVIDSEMAAAIDTMTRDDVGGLRDALNELPAHDDVELQSVLLSEPAGVVFNLVNAAAVAAGGRASRNRSLDENMSLLRHQWQVGDATGFATRAR